MRISADKLGQIVERYLPVLGPQLGHQLIDSIQRLGLSKRGQVGIDSGGGRGGVPQIALDDTQVQPGFE